MKKVGKTTRPFRYGVEGGKERRKREGGREGREEGWGRGEGKEGRMRKETVW